MKILPHSSLQVDLETSTGTFEIYELTDGGLELVSKAGKIFVVDVPANSTRVVIHNAEKPGGDYKPGKHELGSPAEPDEGD